jgi:hypothetical protein
MDVDVRGTQLNYAPGISNYVAQIGSLPLSARRAFKRAISGIKTLALMHQFQREKNEYGRIIAEMSDYAIAYQLMKDAFLEGLGQEKRSTYRRFELIYKEGIITAKRISEITGVTGAAISQWMKPFILKGVLIWCDEHGIQFPDKESLSKAKRSGNAYVKMNGPFGLPSPYDLTGDDRWDTNGELYREYDLDLDDGDDEKYFDDTIDGVSLDIQNDPNKGFDFINMFDSGDKLFSKKNGMQNKNGNNGDGTANSSVISTERLNNELEGILTFN